MAWLILFFLGVIAAAIKDGLLLARLRWRLQAVLTLSTLLLSAYAGSQMDRLTSAQALQLLSTPWFWLPALLLHACLGLWLWRQQTRRPGLAFPAAVLVSPATWVALSGASWCILQMASLPAGWLAGLLTGAAWMAVTFTVTFVVHRLRIPPSRSREAAIAFQLLGLAFIPGRDLSWNQQYLHDLLYVLSNAFLIPTLLGALLAFLYGCWLTLRFAQDWRQHRANETALAGLRCDPPPLTAFLGLSLQGEWRDFQLMLVRRPAQWLLEKALLDLELRLTARSDRLGIVAKIGPIIGLIGTLIPLQPALAGLARGDLQAMGANLQIGFSTTVLGLLVGALCHAVSTAYRHWSEQLLIDMHFLLDYWAQHGDLHAGPLPDLEVQIVPTRFDHP